MATGARCNLMKAELAQCKSTLMAPVLILKTILKTRINNEKHRMEQGLVERIRDMDGPIEPAIKPLCDVLNAIPGVRTHASCQGHVYPCSAPYVMFYGPIEVAAALEKRLREDAHSALGLFKPENLVNDFAALTEMINSTATQVHQAKSLGPMPDDSKQEEKTD